MKYIIIFVVYCMTFLVRCSGETGEKAWDLAESNCLQNLLDQGPNIYMTTNNKKVYATHSLAKPPTELLQNEVKKLILDELIRMVNEDIQ